MKSGATIRILDPKNADLADLEAVLPKGIVYSKKPEDDFYQKSRRWLQNSCAPTMKMVLEADKILSTQDLSDMVTNAELSTKQEKMLDVLLANPRDMVC